MSADRGKSAGGQYQPARDNQGDKARLDRIATRSDEHNTNLSTDRQNTSTNQGDRNSATNTDSKEVFQTIVFGVTSLAGSLSEFISWPPFTHKSPISSPQSTQPIPQTIVSRQEYIDMEVELYNAETSHHSAMRQVKITALMLGGSIALMHLVLKRVPLMPRKISKKITFGAFVVGGLYYGLDKVQKVGATKLRYTRAFNRIQHSNVIVEDGDVKNNNK